MIDYAKEGERKLAYVVAEATTDEAKLEAVVFVQDKHYSPVMPRLNKHILTYHLEDELVGVLTLGWGTQPKGTARKAFGLEEAAGYLEIGKMCIDDKLGTNAESMMVAEAVKWIKVNRPDVQFLYTMADGGMGKVGYCYQASNFWYGGKFDTPIICTDTMEKAHIRSTKSMLQANNDWLPATDPRKYENANRKHTHLCWPTQDYLDHIGWKWYKVYMYRYALPMNKRAAKWLKYNSMWTRGGPGVYPKDDDLQFLVRTKTGVKDNGTEKTAFTLVDQPKFNLGLDNIKVNKKNVFEFSKEI